MPPTSKRGSARHACRRGRARAQCMGRSRGGLTTKIHALVDANGLPIALKLTKARRMMAAAPPMPGALGTAKSSSPTAPTTATRFATPCRARRLGQHQADRAPVTSPPSAPSCIATGTSSSASSTSSSTSGPSPPATKSTPPTTSPSSSSPPPASGCDL